VVSLRISRAKPISELAREFGLDADKIIKLASNENPLGVSPLAMEAMQASLADIAVIRTATASS
jgi:histidinol-phosphate aminotransferase